MRNGYVVLLGAGASADAGLPTAFDMTNRFIDEIRNGADESRARALAYVLGGIHFLQGQRGEFPNHSLNVEDLALTLDALHNRESSMLSPFVGSWNDGMRRFTDIADASRDLFLTLGHDLERMVRSWLTTPGPGDIRYFEALRDFTRDLSHLDLFTLNYDLCVETALANAGVTYTCGFDSSGWNAELFESADAKANIYKLHGSLDWYVDEEDGGIYSNLTPPGDRTPVNTPPPLLIFGRSQKMTAADPFLHLFYTFNRLVGKARVVATVGYGFGDDHINQMILQGMSRDSRKRLIVVGKDEAQTRSSVLTRFPASTPFVQAKRVDFLGGGAKYAFESGTLVQTISALQENAEEDMPFA